MPHEAISQQSEFSHEIKTELIEGLQQVERERPGICSRLFGKNLEEMICLIEREEGIGLGELRRLTEHKKKQERSKNRSICFEIRRCLARLAA